MKILIPIIGFGNAGGYRVLSELANNWILEGHQVSFLVDERSGPPYFPTKASIIKFDVWGIRGKSFASNAKKIYMRKGNAFSIYIGMWRALKKIGGEYDALLANHSLTAYPVALSGNNKTKKFYYVQAYEPEYYSEKKDYKSKILKWLSTFSYLLPLQQIANAPIYINYKNIRTDTWVPPGIDKRIFFRRKQLPTFCGKKSITIGVIGRSEPEKGTRYVLDAFRAIASRNELIRLKVAFGNLPPNWTHDRAEIVVPQNDFELADYYRSVDVLIAPGTLQLGACHYPVLEAMACGTPVITTGYLPANSKNAWIVKVGNSKDIEDAIEKIIATTPEEMENILNLAHCDIKDFYWENVSFKFSKIFS